MPSLLFVDEIMTTSMKRRHVQALLPEERFRDRCSVVRFRFVLFCRPRPPRFAFALARPSSSHLTCVCCLSLPQLPALLSSSSQTSPSSPSMSTRVFVGNLAFRTTDQNLLELFSQVGTVYASIDIRCPRLSRGASIPPGLRVSSSLFALAPLSSPFPNYFASVG